MVLSSHPDEDPLAAVLNNCRIPVSTFQRAIRGCIRAFRILPADENVLLSGLFQAVTETDLTSLGAWRSQAALGLSNRRELIDFVDLAIGIAYLQIQQAEAPIDDSACPGTLAWSLIRKSLGHDICRAVCSRSAQGFLYIPLFSLVKDDGKTTDEWWRLHVWLPDGKRGNPDFRIHAHLPYGQSWVLAGEGIDETYDIQPVASVGSATHSEYRLEHNKGFDERTGKVDRVSTTVHNNHRFVTAKLLGTEVHTRGMTYGIPAASFHASVVAPGQIHVTIFVFDSRRGLVQDAPILGPKDGTSFTNAKNHESGAITPRTLRDLVDEVLEWEELTTCGREEVQNGNLHAASERFEQARTLCESSSVLSEASFYQTTVLKELEAIRFPP